MKRILMATVLALTLAACTDADGALRTAENYGLTNVRVTGYSFWGCGRDDGWRTEITATNSQGRSVRGVVCSGIFKGNTLRLY